jgi:Flp pilus assembly protein TadD
MIDLRYPPAAVRNRLQTAALVLALIVMTIAIYWQTGSFPAVKFDDVIFSDKTPAISSGLGVEGIRWAFTSSHVANWHPVTWLSHMADVTLFGMDAGKHHLVNVAFHLLNGFLLFVALRTMTGRTWESYLVAALFLVHPLHVESVAWIAERKDVLSTFFWLSATLAYIRYAKKPSLARYGVMALLFTLGLLSKQMLVTFPFTLLLLDFWPLRRNEGTTVKKLLAEKIPLIALSVAAGLVAYHVQSTSGAVMRTDVLPLEFRFLNALVVLAGYLHKTVWPVGLAVYYPHPMKSVSMIKAAGAGALLVAITAATVRRARTEPYLAVGWIWYLVTLVPVIGLVQVGAQAMADRYTYIPLIGIFLAVVWGAAEVAERLNIPNPLRLSVAALCLLSLCAASRAQTALWRDTDVLFAHALSVTENNLFIHEALGDGASRAGRDNEAIAHYREAIRISGGDAVARVGLGVVLGKQGKMDEAIEQFRMATEADPENPDARYNLAVALESIGKREEAATQFEMAFRNPPTDPAAMNNIGLALAKAGRLRDAAATFAGALKTVPDDPESNYNMAVALEKMGRKDEASPHFIKALGLRAFDAEGHKKLGIALISLGRLADAEEKFRAAIRLAPDDPEARFNLGAALERQGKTEEAIAQYRETLRLVPSDRDARERIRWIQGFAPPASAPPRSGGTGFNLDFASSRTPGSAPSRLAAFL